MICRENAIRRRLGLAFETSQKLGVCGGQRVWHERRMLPCNWLQAYLWFTYIAFVFGPIQFRDSRPLVVGVYLALISVLTYLGFLLGSGSGGRCSSQREEVCEKPFRVSAKSRLLNRCIWVYAAFAVYTAVVAGLRGTNLSIAGAGVAYNDVYDGYVRGKGALSFEFLAESLLWPFLTIAVVGGLMRWRRINPTQRFVLTSSIVIKVFLATVGSGKQKYLGDIVCFCLAAALIWYARQRAKIQWQIVAAVACVLFGFVCVCVLLLTARYAAIGVNTATINERINLRLSVNCEHPIFLLFGDDVGFGLSTFLGYLSQGWYGMDLAMRLPIKWTYGLGTSYSVGAVLERLGFGDAVLEDTLVFRAGTVYGWGMSKWHTVFTHLANDFGWFGAALVSGWISYLWGWAWQRAVRENCLYAAFVFCWLALGAMFIPGNNQLLHSPGPLLTTTILVYWWWQSQGKRSPAVNGRGVDLGDTRAMM